MQVTLVVVGGKATQGQVSLDLPIVIGRSRSADVTVAHPTISRLHCELYDRGGLLMVRDLDSLNGTLVGGRKIGEAALQPDDEFTVGPLTFRVNYEHLAGMEEGSAVADKHEEPRVKVTSGGRESGKPSPGPRPVAPDSPSESEETLLDDDAPSDFQ